MFNGVSTFEGYLMPKHCSAKTYPYSRKPNVKRNKTKQNPYEKAIRIMLILAYNERNPLESVHEIIHGRFIGR